MPQCHTAGAASRALDVELAEQGDAARDPVIVRPAARQHHRDDEVGRVAGRRQRPPSLGRLVDGSDVDGALVGDVGAPARPQPDGRQHVEEDARQRLVQLVAGAVPARAVDEQAVDVRAVVRRRLVVLHAAEK